jgi:hypothetical protein
MAVWIAISSALAPLMVVVFMTYLDKPKCRPLDPDEAALQWVLSPLKPEILTLEHELVGAGVITSPGTLHAHYEDCKCGLAHLAEAPRTTLESFSRRHRGVVAVHTGSQSAPVFYLANDGARFTPSKDNPLKGWEQ